MEKQKEFWRGSAILLGSAVLAKVLGACFKIPLTNLLGGVGMGYFSCAYGLLLPVYALSITGLSAGVAQSVSSALALGNFEEVRRIRRVARVLCLGVGLLLGIGVVLLAKPFAMAVAAQTASVWAILSIAPAALFGCLAAAERGYWEGIQNMTPTALSQGIEAVIRLAAGLFFCSWTLSHEAMVSGWFSDSVSLRALAAAAAVLGVTLSTGIGWLCFLFYGWLSGKSTGLYPQGKSDTAPASYGVVLKKLFYVIVPVALGAVATNLTSLIDLVTMMRCIRFAQIRSGAEMIQRYGEIAGTNAFPAFVYGTFTGMSVTIFNLVPSVTNMLGKSALPLAACLWTRRDVCGMANQTGCVLSASAALAFPATGGLFVLSEPLMRLLYQSKPEEVQLAAQALVAMLPGMACLCLAFPLCSMLQGMGKAGVTVKYMLFCVAAKLVCNLVLTVQPRFCVIGGGISTSVCYGLLLVLVLWDLRQRLQQPLHLVRCLFPFLLASVASTFAAAACARFVGTDFIGILCSVLAAMAVYGALVLFGVRIRKGKCAR